MAEADSVLRLIERRATRAAAAHYMAADHLAAMNSFATGAGVIAALAVTVLGVGPFLFPELAGSGRKWVDAAVLLAGAALTVLSVLQATGRWGERSARHHDSAAAYGAALRELYATALTEPFDRARLDALFRRLDALATTEVQPPNAIWRRADRRTKKARSSLPARTDLPA